MLHFLKRWLKPRSKAPVSGCDVLESWAAQRQFGFRRVSDDGGAVIEGRNGSHNWRLEWGPAQRRWVRGFELRLRAELEFGGELQLLVMNRQLQEAMEREVFEQYVEGVQTRIDDQTPPEMRWLVMFPKLRGADAAPLKDEFVAVGNHKSWLVRWVDGPLGTALCQKTLPADHPLVLMIGRGRVVMRTEFDEPDVVGLERWVKLFETALREAQRAQEQMATAQSPSTQPSLWSSSTMPAEEVQH